MIQWATLARKRRRTTFGGKCEDGWQGGRNFSAAILRGGGSVKLACSFTGVRDRFPEASLFFTVHLAFRGRGSGTTRAVFAR